MESRGDLRPLRIVRPPDRAQASRERLAFNYGPGSVPSRQLIDAALASEAEPTFATSAYAEPRDWGYAGLFAFTAVLLLRPQDQLPGSPPLHLAEICALIGIGPMLLHRFARRLPVFRITPETIGVLSLGLAILVTAPFSIWPGGAFGEFTDMYAKILIVFVLMMNTLTTPQRLERITWLIVLCVGYVAARGVFDYARGINMVENGRLRGAVSGMFGNPNDLAMNMVTGMQEGINTFMERPFTGVGAGQFQNYNPAERKERWRETHNALIQVAAETGVLGLVAFSFLIIRAALAAATTRRMLRRPRKRGESDQ